MAMSDLEQVLTEMHWPSFLLGAFTGVMVMILPLMLVAGRLSYELGMKSEERKLADEKAAKAEAAE